MAVTTNIGGSDARRSKNTLKTRGIAIITIEYITKVARTLSPVEIFGFESLLEP